MSHFEYGNPMAFDMALQDPVFYMIRRGIRVDVEMKNQLSEEAHARWVKLQSKLDRVVGGHLNTSSNPQMVSFVYGELGLPKRFKKKKVTCDEDAVRASLAFAQDKLSKVSTDEAVYKYQRASVALMLVLKIRTLRKKIESYLDIEMDSDRRMRSQISVGGTETARFSHSKTLWGTGCNLATIPKDLRLMFIADEGWELAEFDLNRGESWVYAHLSNDHELIRIHRSMGDFHSETASAISTAFGKRLDVADVIRLYKADDPFGFKIRFLGKKVNHASSYRMGPFRGAEVINEEADDTGITVTVAQVKEAQRLWLAKYPGIKWWWDEVERKLEVDRTLVTPFGRTRTFYDFWGDALFKEATAYVPQSTSVDYLNYGMLRVYHELVLPGKMQLLHQNHDSILIQYRPSDREEVLGEVQRLLTNSININGHDVTIPIEGSYGQNWRKMTEWKAEKKAA